MLTARQNAFVDHFVTCRNGAEAARRAGYSEKTARQIATETLSKPYMQVALAEKEAKLARKLEIDREAIVGGIIGAIATARQECDGGTMIRGYVSLAKLLGLDKPEVANGVLSAENDALQAKFDSMTDQELMALATGQPLPQVVN